MRMRAYLYAHPIARPTNTCALQMVVLCEYVLRKGTPTPHALINCILFANQHIYFIAIGMFPCCLSFLQKLYIKLKSEHVFEFGKCF